MVYPTISFKYVSLLCHKHWRLISDFEQSLVVNTVVVMSVLCIEKQTLIRLLLEEQYDVGLHSCAFMPVLMILRYPCFVWSHDEIKTRAGTIQLSSDMYHDTGNVIR